MIKILLLFRYRSFRSAKINESLIAGIPVSRTKTKVGFVTLPTPPGICVLALRENKIYMNTYSFNHFQNNIFFYCSIISIFQIKSSFSADHVKA